MVRIVVLQEPHRALAPDVPGPSSPSRNGHPERRPPGQSSTSALPRASPRTGDGTGHRASESTGDGTGHRASESTGDGTGHGTGHRASHRTGLALAALAGILFGLITVGAKAAHAHPMAKAVVSGLAAGLVAVGALRGLRPQRRDLLGLGAVVLTGGILAPTLVLFGLRATSAAHAGLLLTLEIVVTAGLAAAFLHERIARRTAAGLGCLLAAAIAVAAADKGGNSTVAGVLLVAGAAAAFAVDNAVGGHLLARVRPMQIVAMRSLASLPFLAAIWWATASLDGAGWPQRWTDWLILGAGGAVGVGGGSIVHYRAIRHIGAARTAAVNVPIAGLTAAAGGWLMLHESPDWLDLLAVAFVLAGLTLLAARRREPSSPAGQAPVPGPRRPEAKGRPRTRRH